MLKSISSGSLDKAAAADGKPEIRAPSPIPEDPREDDVTKSPQAKAALAKRASETKPAPKKEEDNKTSDDEEKKKKEEEEKKKKEEEEKKKKEEEEKKKKKEEEEKKKKEENKESSSQASKPAPQEENVPVATTKLRGKSKATGQIMGGWI